jgi:hypothetical protein
MQISCNGPDKIVGGSKIKEPLIDGNDTKSVKDEGELRQKIATKVEEKVDDGKKIDKNEQPKNRISESNAVDKQKVASVKDDSHEEVFVEGKVSNKKTVSNIKQQIKNNSTKNSKNNE